MNIYDRYAEGKKSNTSVYGSYAKSMKNGVNDIVIRTQRSRTKKMGEREKTKGFVEEIKPWENFYEDSMLD